MSNEEFEEEILYRFQRFQAFYDNMNFQMRTYRLSHVNLVTSIFDRIIEVFGAELDIIRRASVELDEVIEQRISDLGGINDCMRNVMNQRDEISVTVTREVQECSTRANRTMQAQLRDVFYPTFADLQAQTMNVNLMVMDALSRGNVMDDEDEIIQYLESQYHFFTNQWPQAATQLLRWEQSRFRVESEFEIDETRECLMAPTTVYMRRAASLEYESAMCN